MAYGGLNWYRGDFHVHTPFSRCYRDQGVNARQILERAEELDFLVITDHNTFDGYFFLLEHRQGLTPLLFPGVELLVPAGYAGLKLLAVFNPDLSPEDLELFLRECGIPQWAKGENGFILPRPLQELAVILNRHDCLALWAKVHTKQGILGGVDRVQREYIQSLHWPLTNLELGSGEGPGGVWGSDAHSLGTMANHTTWVKMDSLDFGSLKFALHDLTGRVRPGSSNQKCNHPGIISLRVEGGFLGGQEFNFNPGLNCVIGARGTGKTTLLKLIAFGLGLQNGMEGLLEQVNISLAAGQGEIFHAQRRIGEAVRVYDSLGRNVDFDFAGFSWFFGQGEVERVVLNSQFQLDLLDGMWNSRQINEQYDQATAALAENEQQLARIGQQCDQLQESWAGRGILETRLTELRAYPLAEIQNKLANRNREQQYLASLRDTIRQNKSLIARLPCKGEGDYLLAGAYHATAKAAEELTTLWDEAEREVAARVRQAEEKHRKLEQEYRELLGGCADAKVKELVNERKRIQTEIVALDPIGKRLRQAEQEYAALEAERRRLLQNWTSLGEERFQRRSAAAAEISQVLSPGLRVQITKAGLSLPYREFLQRWLPGLGGHAQKTLETRVQPQRLRLLVTGGEINSLAREAGLALERSRQVIGILGARNALLQLEALDCPDQVQIFLRQGENEKTGQMLSTGQRCTAVLPLLLLAAGRTIIIDQPEDHLDNAYVYTNLVSRLRQLKGQQQFILATHNPNIPVLADAEQNFILESDGHNGWVRAQGAVENPIVKELIQEIMEGGQDAFKRRAVCYGQLAH